MSQFCERKVDPRSGPFPSFLIINYHGTRSGVDNYESCCVVRAQVFSSGSRELSHALRRARPASQRPAAGPRHPAGTSFDQAGPIPRHTPC